ncbi:MAG: ABC transporter ATP-binding protein [Candidatus Tectomicrobia bacterium]|uniref:ABC transporter ATP-binding protein n=1 Tax=Tectimicrobiota bacterium TaxID=2528274 RepID=A0A933GPL6_UNCTE|nr:ABC transporter ATP-binding protein [Candidatus Tectomicrobia bacterium]
MPLLETKKLVKNFFKLCALNRLDFQVEKGEIVAIIGPNGSGKTTFFNCITHIYGPSGGQVLFKGQNITGSKTEKISRLGIGRTFQLIQLFLEMTVLQNMLLAVQEHRGNILSRLFQRDERAEQKRALEILEFLNIAHLKDELASNLSYGQQKLLDFGMVLMPSPELILLDEPTSGVEVEMRQKIMDYVHKLNQQGQTFVVIEHNMDVVMNLCERIIVLDYGEKIAEGTPAEIQNNQRVIEAYFGVEE